MKEAKRTKLRVPNYLIISVLIKLMQAILINNYMQWTKYVKQTTNK